MTAILRKIREVVVCYNFTLYLYIGMANQHEEYEGGDTEQFRNVQETERYLPTYVIQVSGTKRLEKKLRAEKQPLENHFWIVDRERKIDKKGKMVEHQSSCLVVSASLYNSYYYHISKASIENTTTLV